VRSASPPPTSGENAGAGSPSESSAASVPLRLTVAGGSLGLELYGSVALGPLQIQELGWSLPGLRFPIDLSGGVNVFRHRRGELERLSLTATFSALGEFVRPRLREALGRAAAPPRLWPLEQGIGVGLVGELGALAFDLLWAPLDGQARLVVANARGSGTLDVPLGHALRVAETLLGHAGRRKGRLLVVEDLAGNIARELAPLLGARAPQCESARIESLSLSREQLALVVRAGAAPDALTRDAIAALELAQLATEADDALARGDLAGARAHYLSALERAPRHPELVLCVAQIDAAADERAEAALGMLVDCLPATEFGLLGARLLGRVGDLIGARQAVLNATSSEMYAPVAAGSWLALAELEREPAERMHALDRAIACAPALAPARWARFAARAQQGDEAGAIADAEHLEGAARGAREKHRVLARAASALLGHRQLAGAGRLCERALRYVPDDPEAMYGLALSLLAVGERERAALLLGRAIELGDEQGKPCFGACLELGRLLAEQFHDQPEAVARVGHIPAASDRYLEARALEGRWRAELGDLIGASLSYARLREGCELAPAAVIDPRAAEWLVEAALFETGNDGTEAAERHLATALRLTPQDRRVRKLYREAAAALARKRR
jgi:tetratricopeptide (TPR) repeat protein